MKYKKLITTMTLTTLLASNFNAGVIYAAENITAQAKNANQNPDVQKAKETIKLKPTTNPDTQKAIKAVNALFTDTTYTKIAATATSESIQDARILARKVPTNDHNYSLLNNLLTKAATLLSQTTDLRPTSNPDTQKAIQAVNALFTDTTYTKLAATATSKSIQTAFNLTQKVPTSDHNYFLLTTLIKKAKELLNQPSDSDIQAAIDAVHALFTDVTYTKLADNVKNKTVDEVYKLVKKIPVTNPNFSVLNALIKKAKELLNQASDLDQQAVIEAVQALYTDTTYTKLATTANSESIQEARDLIIKVLEDDGIFLSFWNSMVDKAKRLLNETTDLRPTSNPNTQKAIQAVNALFTDTTYTKIAETTTSETIREASDLAYKVPGDDHNFNLLISLLLKAEKLLNQTTNIRPTSNPDTQKAIQAVNALFTDTTYTKIAANVNIDTIDKTSNLLLKIPSCDHNFEVLFSLLLKAATLLNQTTDLRPTSNPDTQKAIKATNALFTDTTYTKLAATTTSKSIHEAFKLTQKVPSEDHNHALLLDILTKAQTLLLNS
ncbi:toxin Cry1Ac domain D-VI-related protein [Enterococcus ratti]|uniref:toxin Cry1Ac domain D-VI-related protein n=1 Tax=Enterococcus ratti TaxID=150033 RepID=UPI003517E7EB